MANVTNPLDRCLVQRNDGTWFVYADAIKGQIMLMAKCQVVRYANFNTFKFRKREDNRSEESLRAEWMGLISIAKDRINLHENEEGASYEPTRRDRRVYKTSPCPTPKGKTRFHLMPHTRAVYEYLCTLGRVTEEELKKQFEKWYHQNKHKIKAKQGDAWRFFQTHRPYLLEGGFLTVSK